MGTVRAVRYPGPVTSAGETIDDGGDGEKCVVANISTRRSEHHEDEDKGPALEQSKSRAFRLAHWCSDLYSCVGCHHKVKTFIEERHLWLVLCQGIECTKREAWEPEKYGYGLLCDTFQECRGNEGLGRSSW